MTERIQTITMPKWGMTMTEGKVTGWLKAPGQRIEMGEEFVEIETDKIANVVEAQVSGLLRRVLVQPGQSAACGAVIALLAEADVPESALDAIAATAPVHAAEVVGLTTTRIETDGFGLNVISAGTGDATPLILLHGFASDASSWMFVQEPLAEKRKVHAIDLPSHGASDVDAKVATPDALADLVLAAIEVVAPDAFHLAGHSLGGRLALRIASRLGPRVRSLTLVAPAGLGRAVNPEFVKTFLAANSRRPMKEALQMLVADPSSVTSDMVERALATKRMDGASEALAAIAAACLGASMTSDATADLAATSAPVLTLWGARDQVIPPPDAGPTMIADVGHIPQMEAAATVIQLLTRHIEAVS